MMRDGAGESLNVVAAFENGDEAALTVGVRGFEQEFGQSDEIIVGEAKLAKGIVDAGIKAGGDENEVWFEGVDGGEQTVSERGAEGAHAGAGGEGEIQRGPEAFAAASFIGVAGEGIERTLVCAAKQHAAVLIEDVLGAIAVMHVPIDDGDFLRPVLLLAMTCGDGDVVEQAETHALGRSCVVAGWAHGAEGVFDLASENGIDGIQDSANGLNGHVIRFGADGGVAGAEVIEARFDIFFGRGDVAAIMAKGEFIQRRHTGRNRLGFANEAGSCQRLCDRHVTLDAFRVTRTGIVLLVDGVEEQGSHGFAVVGGCLRWLAMV